MQKPTNGAKTKIMPYRIAGSPPTPQQLSYRPYTSIRTEITPDLESAGGFHHTEAHKDRTIAE